MSIEDRGQSEYYRTIAREFLKRRGGAFFLSPRDLAAIAGWEARGIPLDVVLEGIDRTFEGLRIRARGTRGLSLAFCDREVGRAMEQHQGRSAGHRSSAPVRSGKRDRARREVERALQSLPPDETELISLFESALMILSADRPDEEALERTEAAVEKTLYDRAAPDERARVIREVGRDLAEKGPEDIEAVSRTRIVKAMRKKNKVPYVSLHYY